MEVQNIPPQPQPTEVVIPPTKSKLSAFLIIGVFLLLIVVGAGAYYLGTKQTKSPPIVISPTQILIPTTISYPTPTMAILDETANWKTYANPTYNYSIKYPSSFTLIAPTPGVSESMREMEIRKSTDDYLNHKILIEVYDPAPNTSEINGYISAELKVVNSYGNVVNKPTTQQIKINNQDATLIRVDFKDGIQEIYFIYNTKRFIQLRWIDDLKPESESTFRQIISTLKLPE